MSHLTVFRMGTGGLLSSSRYHPHFHPAAWGKKRLAGRKKESLLAAGKSSRLSGRDHARLQMLRRPPPREWSFDIPQRICHVGQVRQGEPTRGPRAGGRACRALLRRLRSFSRTMAVSCTRRARVISLLRGGEDDEASRQTDDRDGSFQRPRHELPCGPVAGGAKCAPSSHAVTQCHAAAREGTGKNHRLRGGACTLMP
jgi:hypothetical protein